MLLSLALLLFLQDVAPAQQAPEILGPFIERQDQGQTTRVVLKNGLTLLVREEHTMPLAGITTLVKTGSLDEDDRLEGISRVVQNMSLLGTETRSAQEIARQIKASGGAFDTYTTFEASFYRVVVPAANLALALELQADILWTPAFRSEDLERVVNRVLQEDRSRLDDAPTLTRDKLFETAFTERRRSSPNRGTSESLQAISRDDVLAYHQKYYQPGNIILSIVGAFDREKVLEEVVRLYGGRENLPVEAEVLPEEPPQNGLRYTWRRGPVRQTHLTLGYHTPGILSDDAVTLDVLATILGTGRSSRLNQILREQKHLVSAGSAVLHAYRNWGIFELTVETTDSLEASVAILTEIENIKRYGVTAESIGRAKVSIAAAHFKKLETREGMSENLAYNESLGDAQFSADYFRRLEQITPEKVREAARKYLNFSNLSVFEYLPQSVERYLSVSDYQSQVLDKVVADSRAPDAPEVPVTAEIPQAADGIVANLIGEIQRRSILRGPDVYIREDHRLPIVSFGIFFPGGRLLETADNAGITELMMRTALRGTRSFESPEISRRIEGAGVQLKIVNEPDFFGYILTGISGKMDRALEVLVEIMQEPSFEEPLVEDERALQLIRLRSLPESGRVFGESLFMQVLFGDTPYGRTALGREDSVSRLTGTDLREWFRNNQRKVLPTIFIVGDTRGTALVAPLADALTNEDLEPRDIAAMPRVQPSRSVDQNLSEVPRQQSVLVYGFPGVPWSSADRPALELFLGMVSGVEGGYFQESILESQGLADATETFNVSYSRGGTIYTYASFPPEYEAQVRSGLDSAYGRLRTGEITAASLREAKSSAVGVHDSSLQTQEAQILEYARAVYSGAGIAAVGRYAAAVQRVTSDDLKAVISRYLDPEALRTGLVRATEQ